MQQLRLIFVAGCNAAGKSSFIRAHLSELTGFEIIMTDVYKGRSKEVFFKAIKEKRNIIVETVFNDNSFKDLVNTATNENYHTSLIVLFLDSIQQSVDRVSFRSLEQNGLMISDGNIKINFNESFKNIAQYFFYFNEINFIYTGVKRENTLIMTFNKSELKSYKSTDLTYPQKFADFAFQFERLNEDAYQVIKQNLDYNI